MTYPTLLQYNTAVVHLEHFVLSARFKGGVARRGKRKQLIAYSGGFSRIYPIEIGRKTVALRCWTSEVGQAQERYQKISHYLKTQNLPYFVDFEYIPDGILVEGKEYPVIYMEWVDGFTLGRFIDQHINNKDALLGVADLFLQMVKTLHQKKIAHGDLQDGNLMIYRNGQSWALKLIDYDSLFVPSLQGYPAEIAGVPSYQHPKRANLKVVSERIDYFSELVIYLSLCAYAERPDFWEHEQEERLLFEEEDFKNYAKSHIFQELKQLSPTVQHLTQKLEEFCQINDCQKLSPLEDILPPHTKRSAARTPAGLDQWERLTKLITSSPPLVTPNGSSPTSSLPINLGTLRGFDPLKPTTSKALKAHTSAKSWDAVNQLITDSSPKSKWDEVIKLITDPNHASAPIVLPCRPRPAPAPLKSYAKIADFLTRNPSIFVILGALISFLWLIITLLIG